MTPQESIDELIAGNRRFVRGEPLADPYTASKRHLLSQQAQTPLAAILSCADSRVSPETVFDQCVGNLFIVRVAGNIATPANIGSLEFAVSTFNTPLILVLGHTKCGAIQTTLEEVAQPGTHTSENILSIVNAIRPAAEPILNYAEPERSNQAVRENAKLAANTLRGAATLAQKVDAGKLMIAAATYCLETGSVEFLES